MKAILARLLLFSCFACNQAVMHAQDGTGKASPKHPIALKIQAYSPLSLLVEPFVRSSDVPFTPRFWTGELEVGLSGRSSAQFSVGGMKHWEAQYGWYSPSNAAYRITGAYRYYFATKAFGFRAGPYFAGGFAFARGERQLLSEVSPFIITKRVLSSSVRMGWQLRIKNHFLVDLGVGAEVGFVGTTVLGRDESAALRISAFDYPVAQLATTPDAKGRVWGIAGSPSLALGWLF